MFTLLVSQKSGGNLTDCCKFVNQLFSVGLSIKCWECRSDSDPKCADPFDNSTLSITDCKQNAELDHLPGVKATMCRKIRQKGLWINGFQFVHLFF